MFKFKLRRHLLNFTQIKIVLLQVMRRVKTSRFCQPQLCVRPCVYTVSFITVPVTDLQSRAWVMVLGSARIPTPSINWPSKENIENFVNSCLQVTTSIVY